MTFDAQQEAREIVGETEFYIFDFGGLGREYYTTARKKVSWTPANALDANIVWYPLAIAREGFTSNMSPEPAQPRLVIPCRSTFIRLLKDGGLDQLFVSIIRGFGTDYDNNYRNPWFVGYVSDLNASTTSVSLSLKSLEALFSIQIPRVVYSAYCNNALFDSVCGKILTYWWATVTSIQDRGRRILLNTNVGFSDLPGAPVLNDHQLGRIWKRILLPDNSEDLTAPRSFREILYQSNDLGSGIIEMLLHAPIIDLAVGDKVNFSLGCDHSIQRCVLKHANRQNFVGMPQIPSLNPIVEGF